MSPALAAALWRHRHDFDIVHSHGIFTFETPLSDAIRRLVGRPYVMRPCGVFGPWCLAQGSRLKRPFLFGVRRLLRSAAFVHCTSEGEATDVLRVQPAARTQVIPLGIDAAVAGADGIREPPGVSTAPYLLFLGRLHPIKGLELLIPAFVEARRRTPELELVLAGPNEGMRDRLQAEATELGVGASVHLPGLVTGAEKRELLARARALVLPSHHENFGRVVLEAAALGTPVVVSRGVAVHGEVERCGAGEVAAVDVASLAQGIGRVLARPRSDYADGCARLSALFSWERAAERLAAAYREVLADGR
jgi:glycosyltransferase involved in cell wall biosynthesis